MRGVAPEVFEVVQGAGLGGEHVQNNVTVVLDDPAALVVTLTSPASRAALFQDTIHLVRDGVNLPAVGAGRDHEVIANGRNAGEIEHERIAPPVSITDSRDFDRILETTLVLVRGQLSVVRC